ncbi:hypothetical protein CANARDRAFT_149996 [[Candida] arabinofermentans NRRL YB-2248]|uniref:N-acetyltransferase domain-containing protein n=1 Tax=[Candida] arabinofermentans NRRL YB-2248 TaxID=983967 RepID=A0A1E4T2T6_9ASCO|nr:hypothetical protein CANARDRAFT_149996 [[Candida] arabinofermentans NRRL YB-2248]
MSKVRIALDDLTVNNLGLFNLITAPEEYPQSYIQECKESGELAQYIYFNEVPVGVIVARPIQPTKSKSPVGLVIELLSVLKSYRHNFDLENEAIAYIEKIGKETKHLNFGYILIDKEANDWLYEFIPSRGYIEEDLNDELYKGLNLTKGKENVVLFKKDLVNKLKAPPMPPQSMQFPQIST